MTRITDRTAFGFKIDGEQYVLKEFVMDTKKKTCSNCILNSFHERELSDDWAEFYILCITSTLCVSSIESDNKVHQLQYVKEDNENKK